MLTAAILIIAFACGGGIAAIWQLTRRMDRLYQPKQIEFNITRSKLTLKEVLSNILKNVPTGCMWDVQKDIKNLKRHGDRYVVNGSHEIVFVTVTLVTPYGRFGTFSLPLGDEDGWIEMFEIELRNNVQSLLRDYNRQLNLSKIKEEHRGDWDGVYREGML